MDFSPASLERLTFDFVHHHLGRLRGGSPPPREGWDLSTPLNGDPVFADSLELVTLAGMFTEAFGINHTGLEDLLLGKPSILRWSEVLDRSLCHWQKEIIFFTSGSTGEPKKIPHTLLSLIEEVQTIYPGLLSKEFQNQPTKRIISLVNSNHIYGFLFTILLPDLTGLPVLRVSPLWSDFAPGDLVVTVPQIIHTWDDRKIAVPRGVQLFTSTSPLGEKEAQWLVSQSIPFLEIYGSSETGGIATRSTPHSPYELLPYWQKGSIDSTTGTSTSLVRKIEDTTSTVGLPDTVEWISERSLIPRGRRDQAVQIGGNNVFPQEITRFLEQLPEIHQARVRVFESPGGPRLKVFIVPKQSKILDHESDLNALEQTIRRNCAAALSSPERPVVYTFGSKIPTTPLGKETDW